jgi:hypothetical protein
MKKYLQRKEKEALDEKISSNAIKSKDVGRRLGMQIDKLQKNSGMKNLEKLKDYTKPGGDPAASTFDYERHKQEMLKRFT